MTGQSRHHADQSHTTVAHAMRTRSRLRKRSSHFSWLPTNMSSFPFSYHRPRISRSRKNRSSSARSSTICKGWDCLTLKLRWRHVIHLAGLWRPFFQPNSLSAVMCTYWVVSWCALKSHAHTRCVGKCSARHLGLYWCHRLWSRWHFDTDVGAKVPHLRDVGVDDGPAADLNLDWVLQHLPRQRLHLHDSTDLKIECAHARDATGS